MIHIRTSVFFFFLLGACALSAQKAQVEVAGGVEFGWWLHELGSENPAAFNDLGVSKTHHSPAPFIQVNWLYQIKKWQIGPMLHGGLLVEDDMRGPRDSRRRAERIRIAKKDGSIPMIRYGLHLEYELLRRGSYSLKPAFRYGAWQWSTLHPDRDNFGYQHFGEIVFHHIWHRGKRDYVLRMTYNSQQVFLKEKDNPFEEHHLYFWGTSLGIRF